MLNKDLNLGNKGGLDSFVELAKFTSSNLKKKYGDQWLNPNQELIKDDATTAEAGEAETLSPTVTKKEEEAVLPASEPTIPKQKPQAIAQILNSALKKTQSA